MLAIKLKRIGKKGYAAYRVILAEKRSKVSGRFVEDLGWYNPHTDKFNINKEKADYRLKNGAQPTSSVYNLLVRAGVIKGKKKAVHRIVKQAVYPAVGKEAKAEEVKS